VRVFKTAESNGYEALGVGEISRAKDRRRWVNRKGESPGRAERQVISVVLTVGPGEVPEGRSLEKW